MPAGIKPKNKLRRQSAYLAIKKAKESAKRDERFRRKREEAKDPSLREERQARNVPATIDGKRTWDNEAVGDEEDALGWAIDVERLAKKRKLEQEAAERGDTGEIGEEGEETEGLLEKLKKRDEENDEDEELDEEVDSMLDSASEREEEEEEDDDDDDDDDISDSESAPSKPKRKPDPPKRATSPTMSTATNMDISPEFLKQKFPAVFEQPETPKVLITTSINSTLHHEAQILTTLFPNSSYVRRSAHAHAHKYSVREIAKFASNRDYTALIILMQAHHAKEPDGLDIVLLPAGPHCLFPAQPELVGRTAVTLHNQRDYIFLRRHRYVFREKRATEKSVTNNTDGKPVQGLEDLRVGMQELGPRCTLKLRRIDRGIQWKSGQEWKWSAHAEKERTRFNM
ncbi:Ribosome production factor 1 [Kalmusia sp. IMI 367209]|nr:Ribosome production factor 1 [Kalmusia sp. IMI 367209]